MCPTFDPSESVKHRRYVEVLAEEIQRPYDEIEPLYEDVVYQLKATAHVTEFIPIFAWRRARAILGLR